MTSAHPPEDRCSCPKPQPRRPLPEMLRVGDFRGVRARCEKVMEPVVIYPQVPASCEVELPPCEICHKDPAFTSWAGKAVCQWCLYIYAN